MKIIKNNPYNHNNNYKFYNPIKNNMMINHKKQNN